MGTNDIALARLATIGPSAADRAKLAEINLGIDATMRAVIAGAKYNPNALDQRIDRVTPQGAVPVKAVGERWAAEVPLRTSENAATDRAVQRLCDAMAPHGAESPLRERRGAAAEATLRRAVAAARAELARPEPGAVAPEESTPISAEPEAECVAEPEPEPVLATPEPVAVAAPKAGTITRRKLA